MSQNDNSANIIGNNEENSAQNMLNNLFALSPTPPSPPTSSRQWHPVQLYDNPRSLRRRAPPLPPRRRSRITPSVTTINVEPGPNGELPLPPSPRSRITPSVTTINVEPGPNGEPPLPPPLPPVIWSMAQQEGRRRHRRNAVVATDFIDILLNSVVRPGHPSEHPLRPYTQEYDLLTNTLYSEPTYKTVLSEEGSKELKKINYKKELGYNSSCPIFRTEFEQNQEVTRLPCNHCFVSSAIKKWLEEQRAECPICRLKLPSKEIQVDGEEEEKVAELDDEEEQSSTFRERNPPPLPMSSMLTQIARNIVQQEEDDIQRAILASLDNR